MSSIIRFRYLVSVLLVSFLISATPAVAQQKSLYERLGGYDAVSAVIDELMVRLIKDKQLGRFWAHRGDDGIAREKQLVKDFIASKAGGPIVYPGRENKLSHKGMRISQEDWKIFMVHLNGTLDKFQLPPKERNDVLAFIESTKKDIVELP
ncbi:MAG: group 1 truncated hemoglobin [Sneathiellales bacterium]|nr:group 1 truncated hemoglobin [Sneathiellales bacterium]